MAIAPNWGHLSPKYQYAGYFYDNFNDPRCYLSILYNNIIVPLFGREETRTVEDIKEYYRDYYPWENDIDGIPEENKYDYWEYRDEIQTKLLLIDLRCFTREIIDLTQNQVNDLERFCNFTPVNWNAECDLGHLNPCDILKLEEDLNYILSEWIIENFKQILALKDPNCDKIKEMYKDHSWVKYGNESYEKLLRGETDV